MDYPDSCIRGIRKSGWIKNDGKVSGLAFEPDPNTAKDREDGGFETSINWEDEPEALDIALKNYEHGAVRLQTQIIEYINKIHGSPDALWPERDELPENPYHGNIIFNGSLRSTVIKLIASTLALGASDIIERNRLN